MTTRNGNIFRQARQLLDKKEKGAQLSEEELQLINTAIIPLMVKTNGIFPEDITIGEGLEDLATMMEEAKAMQVTVNRLKQRKDSDPNGADYWLEIEQMSGVVWDVPLTKEELKKIEPHLPKWLREKVAGY